MSFQRRLESSLKNLVVQVFPSGIIFFYQSQFPIPLPDFELLFSQYRLFDIFMLLKVNKRMYMISLSESFNKILFMLVHSPH
jgi:hypothetical protein